MAETKTYQGHTYQRNAPSEPWALVGPAAASGGGVIVTKPNDPVKAQKDALEVTNTQDIITDRQNDNRRQDIQQQIDLAKEGLMLNGSGKVVAIPGWTKPGSSQGGAMALTAEDRGKALNSYGTLINLASGVNDLRSQYDSKFKGWNPLEAIDTMPGGQVFGDKGRIFNDASNSLTAFIATALGLSGQQFNTPAEQKLFIEGILPKAGDTDGQIEAKLNRLDNLISNARDKGRSTLGYTDETDPLLKNSDFTKYLGRTGRAGSVASPNAAGAGATQQSKPIPKEMQAEFDAFLASNPRGQIDPNAYASFRSALDQKYGFAADPAIFEKYRSEADALNKPGGFTTTIPAGNTDLSGIDKLRNEVISNPIGGFFNSWANAGGFGIPSLLDGGKTEAARELNPTASAIGDVAGGTVGAALASGFVNASGRVASPVAAALVGDMGYGGVYGATQSDDRVAGALAGLASGAAGNVVGGQIVRRLPGLVGIRRGPDTLSTAERAVNDAVERTGRDPVIAALTQADELGVPASLADVSPDVNTLAGAAIRRSPTAGGAARDALATRSRGQIDRYRSAIERDLGPITSIPQRSEELTAQARTAAAPLYEAAYSSPPISSPALDTILATPAGRAALSRANTIAANEMRDPRALGFVLDENGAVRLDPTAHIVEQGGELFLLRAPLQERGYTLQSLDYVKRGLDDILEAQRNQVTGRLDLDEDGRAINGVRQQLVAELDRLNPDYAAARAAYAGPAQARDALRQGQDAVTLSPDQLAVNFGRASPAQADQMRLGFQSRLVEGAERARNNANPFQATLDTPAMEQRLHTLYDGAGDSNIARLLLQRDMERDVASSTNRLIGNSMTAERQLADQAFDQNSIWGDVAQGAVETTLTGAPAVTIMRSAAGRGLGQAIKDYRTLGLGRRATALADEIAPIALNMVPADVRALVEDLGTRAAERDAVIAALLERAQLRGAHDGAGVAASLNAQIQR